MQLDEKKPDIIQRTNATQMKGDLDERQPGPKATRIKGNPDLRQRG